MLRGEYIPIDQLDLALQVRRSVFEEEQGLAASYNEDGLDNQAIHFVVFEDDEPVGTGRLLFKNGIYKIGRIAVLKDKRKYGYGDFIVRALLDRGFQGGADRIYVGARTSLQKFYSGIGFEACSEVYEEQGIHHVMMVITPFTIRSKCGGH